MNTKPKLIAVAAIAAVGLALSGCSGAGSPDDGASLSFVTWNGGDAGVSWQNLAAAYEAETGIPVEIEIVPGDTYDSVMTSRIEAGKGPDIFQVMSRDTMVAAGQLLDLSDQPWVDREIPAVKDLAKLFDGKTYTFTGGLDVAGVFYNKDIFEANDLTVPTTWEEFMSTVKTLRAAGITPLAVGARRQVATRTCKPSRWSRRFRQELTRAQNCAVASSRTPTRSGRRRSTASSSWLLPVPTTAMRSVSTGRQARTSSLPARPRCSSRAASRFRPCRRRTRT